MEFIEELWLPLFAGALPAETTCRLWDLFFAEGSSVAYAAVLAILQRLEILILTHSGVDGLQTLVLEALRSWIEPAELVEEVLRILPALNQSRIMRLTVEHADRIANTERRRAHAALSSAVEVTLSMLTLTR